MMTRRALFTSFARSRFHSSSAGASAQQAAIQADGTRLDTAETRHRADRQPVSAEA